MQRRGYLKRFGPFLAYILIAMVILTSSTLIGRYSRDKRLAAPAKSLDSLKVELSEVLLAANSISNADGKQDTVGSALARAENGLKSSLETARELAEEHKHNLGEEVYSQIIASLDQQQALLNTYQDRFKTVGKAIQYNPSLDLDSLDPDVQEDRQQLATRAAAARDNLSKLANNQSSSTLSATSFSLSAVTRGNIGKVSKCFDSLASTTQAGDGSTATDVREECKQQYPRFRQTLVNDLTSAYKTEQAQQSLAMLAGLLTKF